MDSVPLGPFQTLLTPDSPSWGMIEYSLRLHSHSVWRGHGRRETQGRICQTEQEIRAPRAKCCCNLGAGEGIRQESEPYLADPCPRLPGMLGIPHLIPGHRCSCNDRTSSTWQGQEACGSARVVCRAPVLARREQGLGVGLGEVQGIPLYSTVPSLA